MLWLLMYVKSQTACQFQGQDLDPQNLTKILMKRPQQSMQSLAGEVQCTGRGLAANMPASQ